MGIIARLPRSVVVLPVSVSGDIGAVAPPKKGELAEGFIAFCSPQRGR